MVPNVELKANADNKGTTISSSRAYSFLDSYIYTKNARYNALYEKNKEIILMENEAVQTQNAYLLYRAYVEQIRILDSIIVRIRNFIVSNKHTVIELANSIMPSTDKLNKFEGIVHKVMDMPRFKYIYYFINKVTYSDMLAFSNLYQNEVKSYLSTSENMSKDEPFMHSRATEFLKNILSNFNSDNDSLLKMEKIKTMNPSEFNSVTNFFNRRSIIFSVINNDFKMYQLYLRNYTKVLQDMINVLNVQQLKNNDVIINGKVISFTDYYTLYKHGSSMVKCIQDIVNQYDSHFYNKLYAVESNINTYNGILDKVLSYYHSKNGEVLTEAYNDGFINTYELDSHNLINGNYTAHTLLYDNVDIDSVKDDEEDTTTIPDIEENSIDSDEIANYEFDNNIVEDKENDIWKEEFQFSIV